MTIPTVKYFILRADGRIEPGECPLPRDFAERHVVIDGVVRSVIGADNFPEHVTVFHAGRYVSMFVDETGQLKNLPHNEFATTIYRNNLLTHEPGVHDPEDMPDIAGDAVLFATIFNE